MRSQRRLFLSFVPVLSIVMLLVSTQPSAQRAGGAATQTPTRAATSPAASALTSPEQEWGHDIGDDYFLVNYQQLMAYWNKLAKQSNRLHVVDIGKSSEGRPMYMAVITSAANYAKIDTYKTIARRLALGDVASDEEAQRLARDGKAVVWIDGGLHATETLGAQQLLEQVWQMVSRNDDETKRFLDDVIQLCVLVNPDGMDLVSDWYMKHGNMNIPVLYNHYAGHDDNRDFYMAALSESTNIDRVMYREWFPQVMYNHHQTGPQGTVMFAAPFRDPFNYYQHPYAISGIDTVGALMQERFMMEGKAGVTERKGAPYSTWFNGGLRTTAHFHNMIGILTETIGSPDPISIPFSVSKQIPDSSMYWPIAPQTTWHMKDSIEYSITANRAILDYASRYRERVLYNIYKMAKDEIQWGSEDHWTFTPHKTARVQETLVASGAVQPQPVPGAASTSAYGRGGGRGGGGGGRGGGGRGPDPFYTALTTKELRDPRGFIIPSDQPDFGTATKFVNTLLKTGITVMRSTSAFTVNGKQYPANSYVVKTSQAFRPHVLDMFEPQDHPDDIPYPGGPPTAPYDATGYTLAYQMGVKFDRILDGFDGPFEKITTEYAKVPAGAVKTAQAPFGYYFTHQANDSFIVVNRLLAAGEDVSWLVTGPMGAGTFYVTARPTTLALLQKATELGVTFQSTTTAPTGTVSKLRKLRIGLFDQYGSNNMPSGWTRLIFENFEFPFTQVFPPDLDAGNLRSKFDVLVFNGGGIAAGGGGGRGGRGGGGGADVNPPTGGDATAAGAVAPPAGGRGGNRAAGAGTGAAGQGGGFTIAPPGGGRQGRAGFTPEPIPEDLARRQGNVSAQTLAQIKQFVQDGGTIITIAASSRGAAQLFNLPVTDHLVENDKPLPQEKYYIPGSVLRMSLDTKIPVTHGMDNEVDVFFDESPVFKLAPGATTGSVRTIGWFANATPVRSGWAWGQQYLEKGIGMLEGTVGQGRVFLFGPEILFRSQPHGNYKLFFNALYLSVAPELK